MNIGALLREKHIDMPLTYLKNARSACIMLAATTIPSGAVPCSLQEFDRTAPEPISDYVETRGALAFRWATDVDEFGTLDKAWHYIQNAQERPFSGKWEKAGISILFRNPIQSGEAACNFHYGPSDSFTLDHDAPISPHGHEPIGAVVYSGSVDQHALVGPEATDTSPISGSELETYYTNAEGQRERLFASISFFAIIDKGMWAEVIVKPGDIGIALEASVLNFDEQILHSQSGLDVKRGSLADTLKLSETDYELIDTETLKAEYFIIRNAGEFSVQINPTFGSIGYSDFFLISSDNEVLAGGSLYLARVQPVPGQ